MRFTTRIPLSLVLFIGLTFSFTSCKYEEPTLVSFDGIDQVNMEDNQADVAFHFTMDNPNSKTIKLKSSVIKLYINEVFVGTSTLLEPSILPASGKHKVDLKMKIQFEMTVGEMATSFGMAVLTNNLEMHAVGNAKGSMGLFKKNFPIDHKEKIDWADLKKMVM